MSATLDSLINRPYTAGFVTPIESDSAPKGLSEDTIRFISAKKNKRKAMSMTTSLDANKIPNVSSSGILYSSYPALSLKIKL